MTELIFSWTNSLITLILSLLMLISMTLSTQFLVKKIPTPLKPFRFPIQSSVILPLIIISSFTLSLSLVHNICLLTYVPTSVQSLLIILWEAPNLHRKFRIQKKSPNPDSKEKSYIMSIWSWRRKEWFDGLGKNVISLTFAPIPFSSFNEKDNSIECIGLYYRCICH